MNRHQRGGKHAARFASQDLLIIDPGLELWGSERALLDTLPELARSWRKIVLVTPSGAKLAEEVRAQIPSAVCLSAPIGMLHRKGRLARLAATLALFWTVLRVRPSRIYLNQAGLCRMLHPMAGLFRLPLVVHVRIAEDLKRVSGLTSGRSSQCYAILITDSMMEAFTDGEDSSVVPIQVYDAFDLREPIVAVRTERSGVCCTGRLCEGKGQHLLVEALADDVIRGAVRRLDLFGSGVQGDAFESKLRHRINDLDLHGVVSMKGFRADVREQLRTYAVMAVPSRYEPLGRVILEAWESGLVPVVPDSAGGAAEVIQASGGGILARGRTAKGMGDAILQALSLTEEERHALIENGRSWMRSELALSVYSKRLEGILF